MICPNCLNEKCKNIDSRQIKEKRSRRYECAYCGIRFQTIEEIIGILPAGGNPKEYVPVTNEQLDNIRKLFEKVKPYERLL